MKNLRIGILGAGAIVRQRHAPGIWESGLAEIVAVANSRQESAGSFAAEFAPNAVVYDRWEEVCEQGDVDVIWIGTPPVLHEPMVLAALHAGKHVFCQARMSTDLDSALRMERSAREHPSQVTMLCPPPHGLEIDATVRRLLAESIVGSLRHIRLESLHGAFLDPEAPLHWRQRTDLSGKNILTLGICSEVLHRWFGRFHVLSANATTFTAQRSGMDVRIPDQLSVLARTQEDVPLTLEFSGVFSGPPRDRLVLQGTEGLLEIGLLSNSLRFAPKGSSTWEDLVPNPGEFRPWRVERDFLEAVLHPEQPRPKPDFQDGVAYMEVVEKVWNLIHG